MSDTLVDNRYLLLDAIGSGGEAQVYRTLDTITGNELAIRVAFQPGPPHTPGVLPAFHSAWVQFLESGFDSHFGAYQVFELLEGRTLQEVVPISPLDPENWFLFVNQSLDAVDALHTAGWIHGDLNAQNFFLQEVPFPHWKLLELPFLCFDPPSDRSPLYGSIHTLAPEQLNGALADARSDLYALGCLYYYAAAGEYPHPGATNQEIVVSRLRFTPVPLGEKAPHLPAAWSAWVMNLLAIAPQNRPSTLSAARHLLEVA